MSIENNHWVPSIGDPTIMGWSTVAVYFVVAIVCLKAAFTPKLKRNQSNLHQEKQTKYFWLFLFLFLIALGINKQLDLQTLLTQIGRDIAIKYGWFDDRRTIQSSFIVLIGLVSILTLYFLARFFKKNFLSIKISLSGFIILILFILIRASQFNHVIMFIEKSIWYIEITGLIIIGIGAVQFINSANSKEITR